MRLSSAARPTVDERFRVIGFSTRYLRYSSGVSPETRDRRNVSPSTTNSWAAARSAQPGGVLDDGVQNGSGVGDVATERREYLAAGRGLLARIMQAPDPAAASLSLGRSQSPFRTSCSVSLAGCSVQWPDVPSAMDDRDRGPRADVDAIAVGEWGFLPVGQQVVAGVEAGAVGRAQVGEGEA